MQTVREYLSDVHPLQYHIFDSHQEQMLNRGVEHKDRDYEAYSYNIHKNSKPKAGDVFLYRRPGKSTANRKFNIYGGGVIDHITKPDADGNVLAIVKLPFKLKEPLEQTTSKFLENFEWSSKQKTPGSWEHFWNQYGMNVINEKDFMGLVGELYYDLPENTNSDMPNIEEAAEELTELTDEFDVNGFEIEIEDDADREETPDRKTKHTQKLTGRHIDYKKLQATKSTIGLAGEYVVLENLRTKYEGDGAVIEHVAKTEGDGLGYDIRVTLPDKKEIYVEVKTTTKSQKDGFYISPNERSLAARCFAEKEPRKKEYHIYQVYDFDVKNKSGKIKIFENFNEDEFKLMPTNWKVLAK